MTPTLSANSTGRLERLCKHPASRVRIGAGAAGIERLEARFQGQAFSSHRHDTYAIGVTLAGVQTFRYRGEQRYCLPGQMHILHPDETHDGGAGTDEGFAYRIIYIDPSLIQQALGGAPLPFVADPIVDPTLLSDRLVPYAWNIDEAIDDVVGAEITDALATMLLAIASGGPKRAPSLAHASLLRVRDAIAACPATRHSLAELEQLSGLDRWTLARQFRAAFGTSPSRFRTMRQLDHVRRSLADGCSLADAAAEAGFADQSHMSRHFKSTYGQTPAIWASAAFPHSAVAR